MSEKKAELKIRLATSNDTSALTGFFSEKAVLRWFPMNSALEIADAVRIWMSYVDQKAVLAAEIDGRVVGLANLYLAYFKKLSHHALFAVIVDQNFRGKGVGTRLLKTLIQMAQEQFHLDFLHLEVYEKNPAIHLYQRLGFKEYGRQKHFIKEENGGYLDKIMMQKKL
ncbi:MAG: GNAT family N-acetyltransferase [Parachlamydiales bacterium]|jgi:putative acetyltransferase